MGLALIIIGLIVMLLLHFWIGLALLIVGIVLVFVPAAPYGYHHYRRPPP